MWVYHYIMSICYFVMWNYKANKLKFTTLAIVVQSYRIEENIGSRPFYGGSWSTYWLPLHMRQLFVVSRFTSWCQRRLRSLIVTFLGDLFSVFL